MQFAGPNCCESGYLSNEAVKVLGGPLHHSVRSNVSKGSQRQNGLELVSMRHIRSTRETGLNSMNEPEHPSGPCIPPVVHRKLTTFGSTNLSTPVGFVQ